MSVKEIDKKTIESLLPHREPMLLIDKLTNIVPLKFMTVSAKAIQELITRVETLETKVAALEAG